jgi:hypothetical protein
MMVYVITVHLLLWKRLACVAMMGRQFNEFVSTLKSPYDISFGTIGMNPKLRDSVFPLN